MKKMLKYRAVSALLSALLLCTTVFTGITLSADADNEQLPVFSAVSAIETAKEKKRLDIDCVWSYSEKTVVQNKDTKEYLPTGPFVSKILDKCDGKCSNTADIRAAFPEMLYKWETGLRTGEGFAVKNGKVVTYVGYNTNHAPALTFTAPKSGTVRLYDPNGGDIAGLLPDKTYWTMETAGEKAGIAIYKNDEKIWPADSDFTVISHENRSTAFPDIKDISVMQGDKLRIMLIPLNNNYGYFELAPQVDYTSLTETLPIYDAVSYITGAQANKKLDITDLWSYSEKNLSADETGTYLPQGGFIAKVLDKCDGKCSNTAAIKTALANMLYKWESGQRTGEGFAVKDGKVVTYVGHNTGHAPALTFTAPSTGKIRLFDKNGGNVAACMPKNVYWTLDGKDEKIGVAIYKNDEKIWPENDDYSLLTNSTQSVEFPDISDVAVKKNDKLRIMLVPINNNFGYVEFAPSVQYLSVEEDMPEYKASDSVSAALASGAVPSDSKWIYTSQTVKLNDETGLYLPDSEWYHPDLEIAESDSADVNAALGKQLLVKGKNTGLALKDGKVITYVGYAKGGGVAALTFVAPLSGTVNLSDPDEVKIGTAGTGKPFWTFHQPKRVGVAIYRNEEKIWPEAEPYSVLTGDTWDNGKTVYGNKWLDMPNLGDIRVERGDELKIALIPIDLHWGYFALNPCVSYKEVDAVQPEIKENPKYNSVDGVETALKNGEFDGTSWLFEGMPCYPDADGVNTSFGSWSKLTLIKGTQSDKSIAAAVPDWLKLDGTNIGISVHNGQVIMSSGASGADYATSLTFVVPKSGVIDISDPTGGIFGTSGAGKPFWSINSNDKIAGLAIYKNNEKIWPADSEYYKLQGKWDTETKKYVDNEDKIQFPALKNISVTAGDRIRIAAIPVKNSWLYVSLSPKIEYKTVIEDGKTPPTDDGEKTAATYSAVSAVSKAIKNKSLNGSPWTIQAVKNINSDVVGEDMKLGALFEENTPHILKGMSFSSTSFPFEWFDVPDSNIAITVNAANRLLIPTGSYTGSGYTVWPAVTFTAPATGKIRLHSSAESSGVSAAPKSGPYYMLQPSKDPDEGGRYSYCIYKNNTKIWPLDDSDENYLTVQRRTVKFPDIDMQIYKGDQIRIIAYGGTWGFVTLSPVVDYLSYNNSERPANDSPVWSFKSEDDNAGGFTDFDDLVFDEDTYDDTENGEIQNDAAENENKPTKRVVKKLLRRRRVPKSETNIFTVVMIIVISVLAVGAVVLSAIVIIKKKRRKEKGNGV